MKIKRFYAPTMRKALEEVREEQGPDAVILSKRKLPDGVEVVSATDYDEALLRQSTPASGGPDPEIEPPIAVVPEPHVNTDQKSWDSLHTEIESLKASLNTRLEELQWDSSQRDNPALARITRRLLAMDLDKSLVRTVTGLTGRLEDETRMWRAAIGLIARRVPLTDIDICDMGGVFCMVGPTGTGKTTNIAKLATRYALAHGADRVGLVTTDDARIGAQEHLFRFGRILGVPVQVATTPDELKQTLRQLEDKELVLIDTTGCGPRDATVFNHLTALLSQSPGINIILTLAANVQTAGLRQTVRAFEQLGLDSAIITKLDEAASLGGVISTLIEANLPVSYVTNGQSIPEDITPGANSRTSLMTQLVQLGDEQDADATVNETLDEIEMTFEPRRFVGNA